MYHINIDSGSPDPGTHTRCPHCAEIILKAAKICKHYGGKKVGDSWDALIP
jgi:RNA polymerase subunit RPABC4/transcription elongation factor Spt4